MNRDREPRLPKFALFAIFARCQRALGAFAPKRFAKRRHRAVVGVDADGEGVRLVAIERQGRSGYRLVGISGLALTDGQIPSNFAYIPDAQRVHSDDSIILHGGYIGATFCW